MGNKTAQKENNYPANFNRLVRYFTKTKAGYAFASIDNQRHINAINNQLLERLNKQEINIVIYNFDTQSDLSIMGQLLQEKKEGVDAIIINNLGALAELHDGVLTKKGSNYIQELNFAREELYNLQISILFWASKSLLSIISNQAADLYTQRSINSVYFDNFPDESKPEKELETRFLSDYRKTPDFEALELKIKLLKKQLADAEANNYPISSIANQFVLPLAKTYSEIDLHQQSKELLEKYEKHYNKNNLDNITDLAEIAKNAKLYKKAIDYYKIAIKLAKTQNDEHAITYLYSCLGEIYQELGDYDKALQCYTYFNQYLKELSEANPKK